MICVFLFMFSYTDLRVCFFFLIKTAVLGTLCLLGKMCRSTLSERVF